MFEIINAMAIIAALIILCWTLDLDDEQEDENHLN